MATSRADAEAILAQVQDVADARMRPMMGGWLVYVDEVLVGQINEGELFVKRTGFADREPIDLPARPPYEGAAPALVVDAAHRADAAFLHDLLAGTVAELAAGRRR